MSQSKICKFQDLVHFKAIVRGMQGLHFIKMTHWQTVIAIYRKLQKKSYIFLLTLYSANNNKSSTNQKGRVRYPIHFFLFFLQTVNNEGNSSFMAQLLLSSIVSAKVPRSFMFAKQHQIKLYQFLLFCKKPFLSEGLI